jgi:hypothetical protein
MIEQLYELWDRCFTRMPEMEERLRTASTRYASLKKSSVAAVTKWEWTALPRYELEPFYFELGDTRRGRVMKAEPDKKNGRYEYGFSASGNLTVERQHVEFQGQYYETFFQHQEAEVSSHLFSYNMEKSPINCTRLYAEETDVLCLQSWATMGYAQHIYILSKGRITWRLTNHSPFSRKAFGGVTEIEYCDNDEVRIFAGAKRGTSNQIYSGPVVANNSVGFEGRELRLLVPSIQNAS